MVMKWFSGIAWKFHAGQAVVRMYCLGAWVWVCVCVYWVLIGGNGWAVCVWAGLGRAESWSEMRSVVECSIVECI